MVTLSVTFCCEVESEDIASPETPEPDRGEGNDDQHESHERHR
jgi:hypothetical protein